MIGFEYRGEIEEGILDLRLAENEKRTYHSRSETMLHSLVKKKSSRVFIPGVVYKCSRNVDHKYTPV